MRRKRNIYKFGDKKHSKWGKASLVLAILSFLGGIVMVAISIENAGNANAYIGSAGVFALIVAVASLFMGLASLGEDSYKFYPVLGSICSGVVLAGWVAVYVLGFC